MLLKHNSPKAKPSGLRTKPFPPSQGSSSAGGFWLLFTRLAAVAPQPGKPQSLFVLAGALLKSSSFIFSCAGQLSHGQILLLLVLTTTAVTCRSDGAIKELQEGAMGAVRELQDGCRRTSKSFGPQQASSLSQNQCAPATKESLSGQGWCFL